MKKCVVIDTFDGEKQLKDLFYDWELVCIKLIHPIVYLKEEWPNNYMYYRHEEQFVKDYNTWPSQFYRLTDYRSGYDLNRWFVTGIIRIANNPYPNESYGISFRINWMDFRFNTSRFVRMFKVFKQENAVKVKQYYKDLFVPAPDITKEQLRDMDLRCNRPIKESYRVNVMDWITPINQDNIMIDPDNYDKQLEVIEWVLKKYNTESITEPVKEEETIDDVIVDAVITSMPDCANETINEEPVTEPEFDD